MVVWGGLTNRWEKKRVKGKGEKERYNHLNAKFQRKSSLVVQMAKASAYNAGDPGLIPGSWRSPGEGWQPTPVLLSEKSHGRRSLVGYNPWGHKELDTTEQLHFFQRIIRRDKKAFLSDQCKDIEENNRMEKTRDLFKKIRDTKGTFHAKMGTIKDRDCMDLTEAEDIKKRWQEYTEELYKKDLHDPDNQGCMTTQPRARHPGMQSQVGLRKHHYKQS